MLQNNMILYRITRRVVDNMGLPQAFDTEEIMDKSSAWYQNVGKTTSPCYML